MKAHELYTLLERDFIKPQLTDYDWAANMRAIADLISDNFKKRNMGVLADFASDITRVYTAVFPSPRVLNELLKSNVHDVLLLIHHPAVWVLGNTSDGEVFRSIDRELLLRCKERRIAIYCLHVPLDDYGQYGTSVTLAHALQIEPQRKFSLYFGAYAGVFGFSVFRMVSDVYQLFEKVVGHQVQRYDYGPDQFDGMIAVIAGGGLMLEALQEIYDAGVKVLVTGVTVNNPFTQPAHEYAQRNGITILGGTHYSTEQFACRALCEYFKKVGLPAQFIVDEPSMGDL